MHFGAPVSFDRRLGIGENGRYLGVGKSRSNNFERKTMKKTIAVAVLSVCLSFAAGVAVAERVRDWADLERAHNHVQEAIHELDHARAANHYDMAGHGAKAEEHLRAAEHELHEAIEASKAAR
jgi:hypothetical protein